MKMMYAKIKEQIYDFYKYYYYIMKQSKTPLILKNNLRYIISYLMKKENQQFHIFFSEIIKLSEYNKKIQNLLIQFEHFSDLDFKLKTADYALKIAKDLEQIKRKIQNIIVDINSRSSVSNDNQEDKKTSKEHNKKSIQSVLKYNLTLSRFILETLMNYKFNESTPLNIELLEDYLSFHFSNDKIFIFSKPLTDFNIPLNKLDTVIITGLASDGGKSITALFPHEISNDGISSMHVSTIKKAEINFLTM